jgi:hypothetical protein
MGVPTSDVGYTLATTGRGDHEVHKGHVVALKSLVHVYITIIILTSQSDNRYVGSSQENLCYDTNPLRVFYVQGASCILNPDLREETDIVLAYRERPRNSRPV